MKKQIAIIMNDKAEGERLKSSLLSDYLTTNKGEQYPPPVVIVREDKSEVSGIKDQATTIDLFITDNPLNVRELAEIGRVLYIYRTNDITGASLARQYGAFDISNEIGFLLHMRIMFLLYEIPTEAKIKSRGEGKEIELRGVRIDPIRRVCFVGENKINLGFKEFEVLYCLMRNVDRPLTREEIMKEVWHTDSPLDTKTVDVHMRWIRKKLLIEGKMECEFVSTVRQVGYVVYSEPVKEE